MRLISRCSQSGKGFIGAMTHYADLNTSSSALEVLRRPGCHPGRHETYVVACGGDATCGTKPWSS